MSSDYVAPKRDRGAFHCPFCGVYAKQDWIRVMLKFDSARKPGHYDTLKLSRCQHCEEPAIWRNKTLLRPHGGTALLPHHDLPDEIKVDYMEAREIVTISPRGAAALLRLAIQKLCKHVGGKGKKLDEDIKDFVKQGLPVPVQKALDSVRVIGNNAVHPGVIDLKDDQKTAQKLFGLVNFITEKMITEPREIDEFYNDLPEGAQDAITKRDGQAAGDAGSATLATSPAKAK